MIQLLAYPAQRYIRELDITMRLQNRKILLFIDNFSGHKIDYNLTNIRLEFFAPNLTPFVQPLDAGIIRCFKAHYRALFCQRALELDTLGKENIFEINIHEAMLMAKEAWDAVQPTTIKHCWEHTGIQRDPIMLRIPARRGHESEHGVSQTSSDAWNILEDLATSRKTLPEAEDNLKKVYGSTYQDSVWRPALSAITGSETTEAALDELAKFKAAAAAKNGTVEVGDLDGPMKAVETELMDAVVELKTRRRIFGALPSLEDLVNPPGEAGELETSENPDRFESDADIVEFVRNGVTREAEDEDVEDDIEECPPPQMSRPEMAKLCETLRAVCIGAGVEAAYDLSKVLRKFETQIRVVELQRSTQQRLDGWLASS
jgi:DDE superfamily endonuclease